MTMVATVDGHWIVSVSTYLDEALGVGMLRWQDCPDVRLPAFLSAAFDIACVDLLGTVCAFAHRRGADVPSPTATAKQLALLRDTLELPIVLVEPRIPSWRRKRLIEQRVAFIAPSTQLYLPPLGIDLRDTTRGDHPGAPDDQTEPFAPATQVVLLSLLLDAQRHDTEPEALAKVVGYSPMSISRAARALERAGLITRRRRGRHRTLLLHGDPRAVWDRAQPQLVSPVRARYVVPITDLTGALDAGETALSQRSMLAPTPTRTVAVSAAVWSRHGIQRATHAHGDAIEEAGTMTVEVWTYPPASLSRGNTVDPLSLYLSLRDHVDDRVAQARASLTAVLG